jgi:hypothetical protein
MLGLAFSTVNTDSSLLSKIAN